MISLLTNPHTKIVWECAIVCVSTIIVSISEIFIGNPRWLPYDFVQMNSRCRHQNLKSRPVKFLQKMYMKKVNVLVHGWPAKLPTSLSA